jgi:ABC-type multidrug transport system permease subunit
MLTKMIARADTVVRVPASEETGGLASSVEGATDAKGDLTPAAYAGAYAIHTYGKLLTEIGIGLGVLALVAVVVAAVLWRRTKKQKKAAQDTKA